MVSHGRVKTKEYCILSSLKVVTVALERWSLTRGRNNSDLTREIFRYFGKVVAKERWLQEEVRLDSNLLISYLLDFFR